MDNIKYVKLLTMVHPYLKRQDTNMRQALTVEEKLAVTLRYLATGRNFEDLKFSALMGPRTISYAVMETCEALIYVLKDYMKGDRNIRGRIDKVILSLFGASSVTESVTSSKQFLTVSGRVDSIVLSSHTLLSSSSLAMFDNIQIVLAIFGGYIATSMIFLKNPHFLHKKKRIKFTCTHISHRGGAGENYENTTTAFKRAVEMGTDMLELDCQLTKDNQVVVCHDKNLLRSTGVDQCISDTNYNDLPLYKKSLPIDFDPLVTFSGSGEEGERRIPLLSQVFQMFPKTPINIDVKTNNNFLIKEVDRLIREHKREDITVWGSFSSEITNKCHLQNPNVNLLFSLKKVVKLVLLFYTGLLPFIPLRETHLEIFHPSMVLHSSWKNHMIKNGPLLLYLPTFLVKTIDLLLMNKALFKHLDKRGIQTYVWVLNYENQFQEVFECGVTGIMTDYPSRLMRFLQENPQYLKCKLRTDERQQQVFGQ